MSINFDEHSNFGYSTIQAGSSIIGSAGSPKTIVVGTGDGAHFPTGDGVEQWNVVVWPPSARPLATNSEIIRVTRSGDTLTTVARGQEGTAALGTISAGYQVMAAVTKKTLTDIEGVVGLIEYDVVDKSGAALTVANTTTETVIYTYTVAANALGTDKQLFIRLQGDWKQNSGGAADHPRLRVKLGGAIYLDTKVVGSNLSGNDATRYPWWGEVRVMNLGVANQQWASMKSRILEKRNGNGFGTFATGAGVTYNNAAGVGSTIDFVESDGANSAGIDTTANMTVDVTVQLSGAINQDIVRKYVQAAILG